MKAPIAKECNNAKILASPKKNARPGYEHGELKSGRGGKGGKVKSRKQAIAIALHEAGASKKQSPSDKKRSYARSKSKEAHGRTGQQEREGRSHVGARGRKESSSTMRGKSRSGGSKTSARSRAAAK